MPLALSNAHFLDAGPHLTERIEGLKPDEKKHGSKILVEPVSVQAPQYFQ